MFGNVAASRGMPVNDNIATANKMAERAQGMLDAASLLQGGAGKRGKVWGVMLGVLAAGSAVVGALWCWTTSYCWDTKSNGRVGPVDNAAASEPDNSYKPMNGLNPGWRTTQNGTTCYCTVPKGCAEGCVGPLSQPVYQSSNCQIPANQGTPSCAGYATCPSRPDTEAAYCNAASGAYVNTMALTVVPAADLPLQCQSGVSYSNASDGHRCGLAPAPAAPYQPDGQGVWDDLTPGQGMDAATTTIPDWVRSSPLSVKQVKDLTNETWKQAAQAPGYDGAPYRPITDAEAAAAANAMKQQGFDWPRVSDMLSSPSPAAALNPANNAGAQSASAEGIQQGVDTANQANYPSPVPTTGVAPISQGNYSPAPSAGTAPGGATNVTVNVKAELDLGPNPGNGPPDFNDPPGWQKWWERFKGSVPFLDTQRIEQTQVGNGQIQCPTDQATFWDRTFVLDQHCTLLDPLRDYIRSAFKLLWMLTTFLVLWNA